MGRGEGKEVEEGGIEGREEGDKVGGLNEAHEGRKKGK